MVLASTSFRLVTGLSSALSLLSFASDGRVASVVKCGAACRADERCGGFVWDVDAVAPCRFVVDPAVVGNVSTNVSAAYVMTNNYAGNSTLLEIPTPYLNWEQATLKCQSLNMRLVTYPMTNRDRAILTIRKLGWFYVDLKRQANGTYASSNRSMVLPSDYGFQWYPSNPDFGNEECMGMGGTPLLTFDRPCTATQDGQYTLFCMV
ncbi:uncharacterized protein LOC108674171 [Hyalella azteca]|uniref:Uncharacterized protein LOC108674171 n=1 Tax=Hyalella azteca TaxID=294128 RepID=A0A8B7NXG3_HYAAZ|nr:uncharacterized protein LOC108674171 [Hyalella azteca]